MRRTEALECVTSSWPSLLGGGSIFRLRNHETLLRYVIGATLAIFVAYGLFSLPTLLLRWRPPPSAILACIIWCLIALTPIVLRRRGLNRLALLAAGAGMIALRTLLGRIAIGHFPPGDAHMYLILAEHLRVGHVLEVYEPFMGVQTWALFPPLYPTLLAIWSMVGGLSTTSIVVFNALVDTLSAAIIVMLAEALGKRRAGLVAAWIFLIWPSTLLSAPLAQKEGLCTLLVLLLALQWVKYVQASRPGAREAGAIGISAGLLALTQPGVVPLAALFGLIALGGGAKRFFVFGLVAMPAALAATMLPWWIRNFAVFGRFVPLTSAGGYGLWIGNNPDANGHWLPPPRSLHGLSEIAFGQAAARMAMLWIKENPVGFARVTVAKALRGWGIAEFGADRFASSKPTTNAMVCGLMFAVSQVLHFALLIAAALRTSVLRVPGSRVLLLLVLACLAQTLFFGAFFEFGERHREFATPFLLLLAVWGISDPIAAGDKVKSELSCPERNELIIVPR